MNLIVSERRHGTHGELWLNGDRWHLDADPHVAMRAKKVFDGMRTDSKTGVLTIGNNPEICRDLEWFAQRFPLTIHDEQVLSRSASRHRDQIKRMEEYIDPDYKPQPFELALPARDYQAVAARMFLDQGFLLIGDEVGLGKTIMAICAMMDPRTLPMVIACHANLARQWEREINRFAPALFTHVIDRTQPYTLPKRDGRGPDVLLIGFMKLKGWAKILSRMCSSMVVDEIQELRHHDTEKYSAAKVIANGVQMRLGMSATPIHNYGGEMYNVLEILCPGRLGSRVDFCNTWCVSDYGKLKLKDPAAFGAWLRNEHIMIRRTKKDVGRELPPLTKIMHHVDADASVFEGVADKASELALRLLARGGDTRSFDSVSATGQFDMLMRQTTGIAKAPEAAEFIRMLVESGESVLVGAWHRAVHDLLRERLKAYRPAFYTGEESGLRKAAEAQRFIDGDTPIMIMSNRSGSGLDGLQYRCRTAVIVELDWSPAIAEQFIGRLNRDGQPDPVTAYILVSEEGTDPHICEMLGVKKDQVDGIRLAQSSGPLQQHDSATAIREMARRYLARRPVAVAQ